MSSGMVIKMSAGILPPIKQKKTPALNNQMLAKARFAPCRGVQLIGLVFFGLAPNVANQ